MTDTDLATADSLSWEAPGPGTWEFDAGHQQRPYPRVMLDWAPAAFSEGFRAGFAQLGVPLETMAVGDVNGWLYMRPVPAGDDSGGSLPPRIVLAIVFRVVPELRRRLATARTVFDERPWLTAVDAWEAGGRQAAAERQARLAAIDPATCSDNDLAGLVGEVNDAAADAFRLHFLHAPLTAVAIGRFVLRTEELTGIPADEAFEMLAGYSDSTREPLELLDEILAAIPAGFDLSGDPDDVFEALGATRAGAPLAEYLDRFGDTIVNDESPLGETLGERPALVVRSLLARVDPAARDPRLRADEHAAAVRARIPAEDLDEWDRLLADARRVSSLRDDDVGAALRLIGRSRHVVREAGARLAARGVLHDPESAFDITAAEIGDLLTGRATETDADVNHARRLLAATATPPARLGPPEDEPDFSRFPKAVADVTQAAFAFISRLDGEAGADGLTGLGIGTEAATGRARVVLDAADVLTVEPGDVLVTPMTTPAFNAAIAASAALVCDHGGNASHAAIMAREFGLPAVVGTGGATMAIPDGAVVTVDPTAGTVTIVEDQPQEPT